MEEVHSLCYHGNGGFIHSEVYDMPIRHRHYHLRKIVDFVEKQNETMNGNKETTKDINPSSKVHPPDFISKVKAPKK